MKQFENAIKNGMNIKKKNKTTMSNNKQTMKLYTEKQVIQMIEKSRETGLTAEYLILTTPPIQLPSDEKIEEYADSVMPYAEKIGGETYTAYRAIKLGAKWMRKIVQGGEK